MPKWKTNKLVNQYICTNRNISTIKIRGMPSQKNFDEDDAAIDLFRLLPKYEQYLQTLDQSVDIVQYYEPFPFSVDNYVTFKNNAEMC